MRITIKRERSCCLILIIFFLIDFFGKSITNLQINSTKLLHLTSYLPKEENL